MAFLDTRVKVQHPCPFCEFSAQFPEAEVAQWCNGTDEVLHITVRDEEALDEVLAYARENLGARDLFRDGASALTMTRVCACNRAPSVSWYAHRNGLWLVPPITYRGGWETHRIISPGKEELARFVADVERIGTIEVVSHRPRESLDSLGDLGIVPVHLFQSLTDRQVHSLVAAYEYGLFEIPAKARLSAVARRAGLSRSTFGEHLRKGVQQILRNAYPHLKLRDSAQAPQKPARVSRPSVKVELDRGFEEDSEDAEDSGPRGVPVIRIRYS